MPSDTVLTRDELLENDGIAANWEAIVEFVAEWIEDHNSWGDEAADENARLWRQEMLDASES